MRILLPLGCLALVLSAGWCDSKTAPFFLPGATSPQTGNLTGLVAFGTTPISGATVSLSGTPVRSTTTGANGIYNFTDLSVGSYTVTTTAPLFSCLSPMVLIPLDQTITQNIACTPLPGSVTGAVRVSGTGQAGVVVTLLGSGRSITGTTGSAGTYTITDVPPGTYTASITPPSGTTCPGNATDIVVQSNLQTTRNFDCTLLPGAISGTVRLDGAPAAGVVVTVRQGATIFGTATTTAAGIYLVSGLAPGLYVASITPPSGSTCTNNPADVAVAANQLATADFNCTTPTP